MNSILRQQLEYAQASGLEIDIDSRFSWVSMTVNGEELCVMQDDDAEDFIDDVDILWNNSTEFDSTYDDAALICGYPYLALRA